MLSLLIALLALLSQLSSHYMNVKANNENTIHAQKLIEIIEPISMYILNKENTIDGPKKLEKPNPSNEKILAACLMLASETYNLPPAIMVGIFLHEKGKIGEKYPLKNGTYDLGPMRINSSHLPKIALRWVVSEEEAEKWILNDPCTNMGVSAWLLHNHVFETESLSKALDYYSRDDPNYKENVIQIMKENNLVRK